jgi:hypothetical protein
VGHPNYDAFTVKDEIVSDVWERCPGLGFGVGFGPDALAFGEYVVEGAQIPLRGCHRFCAASRALAMAFKRS